MPPQIIADDLCEPALCKGPTRVVIERRTAGHRGSDLGPYEALAKPLPLAGGNRDLGAVTARLRREFPWMADAIDRHRMSCRGSERPLFRTTAVAWTSL